MIRNIKITSKLLLLCSAFVLPIGYISEALIVNIDKDMDIARSEAAGNNYFHPLHDTLVSLIGSGIDSTQTVKLSATEKALCSADQTYNQLPTYSAMTKAIETLIANPKDVTASDNALSAVMNQISKVGDTSGLTLDPVLDSYYAQDIALVKIPAIEAATARTYRTAQPLMKGEMSPDIIVAFLGSKGELTSLISGLDSDMASGIAGNTDGSMEQALRSSYTKLQASTKIYLAMLDTMANIVADKPSDKDFLAAYQAMAQDSYAYNDVVIKELDHLLTQRFSALQHGMYTKLGVMFGIFLLAVAVAWVVARSIARPVSHLNNVMDVLAEGNTDIDIPHKERKDEIGGMARAVNIFKENALKIKQMQSEQALAAQQRETERRETTNKIASGFEQEMSGVIGTVTNSSSDLRLTAESMEHTAKEASHKVAEANQQTDMASKNVQTIAAATQQLSASIAEVSRQVQEAAEVSNDAAGQTDKTNNMIQKLSNTVGKIGDVVNLINQIAGQTNLLALNATIEAARAGEAGKGFAVVASEVKTLASQTAKATEEISRQIGDVQSETAQAVTAIQGIGRIINSIKENSNRISYAVSEQEKATHEIAANAQEAVDRSTKVASNMENIMVVTRETEANANKVLTSAKGLTEASGKLNDQTSNFLNTIRR